MLKTNKSTLEVIFLCKFFSLPWCASLNTVTLINGIFDFTCGNAVRKQTSHYKLFYSWKIFSILVC